MDVMFVIDATGSMGDEITYLQTEFDGIVESLARNNPQVSLRYGLVMYRDIGDEYVVRDYGFTSNPRVLRDQLRKQQANGGGDYPEAMEQAIDKAVDARWRDGNTAKVMFLVADAPPHDENLARAFESFKEARKEGIRIYPLGASGVADTAEYLMRMGAVMTQGRYLFLTDDSGVGNSHAEPKVPCYVVTPLNQLIERVLNSELRGTRVEPAAGSIIREVGRYDNGECNK
jgi:Mg-chelatase subunit ChlD